MRLKKRWLEKGLFVEEMGLLGDEPYRELELVDLPIEILYIICKKLSYETLFNLSCTNYFFYLIVKDKSFWFGYCILDKFKEGNQFGKNIFWFYINC